MTFIDDAGAGELDEQYDAETDPSEQLADAGAYDPDVPYDVHMNERARDVHDREAQEWVQTHLK